MPQAFFWLSHGDCDALVLVDGIAGSKCHLLQIRHNYGGWKGTVISVASFQNATQSGDNRTCEYHEIEGQERNV